MLEFNATLIAQAVDLILLLMVVVGIPVLIFRFFSKYKKTSSRIEKIENDLTEIKKILKDKIKDS